MCTQYQNQWLVYVITMSLLVGVGYLVYYWQCPDMQPYFLTLFSQYNLQKFNFGRTAEQNLLHVVLLTWIALNLLCYMFFRFENNCLNWILLYYVLCPKCFHVFIFMMTRLFILLYTQLNTCTIL